LDLAFAILADAVAFIFDALEGFVNRVQLLPLSIIEDKIDFPIPLIAC
jgi:hypothetical protein